MLLVNGKTKLLVQNPGANVGKYKISWPDLPGNKKLLLVGGPSGPNSPIKVDCAGPWPKEYMAVAAGNWDYSDSVEVTLTHSLVDCSDVVKLVVIKVELDEIASHPNNALALNNTYVAQDDIVEVLKDWKNRYKGSVEPTLTGMTYKWERRDLPP